MVAVEHVGKQNRRVERQLGLGAALDHAQSAARRAAERRTVQPLATQQRHQRHALVDEARATSAAGRQRAARLDGDDRQQRRIGDGAVGHAAERRHVRRAALEPPLVEKREPDAVRLDVAELHARAALSRSPC
jgi:hypothetical protein